MEHRRELLSKAVQADEQGTLDLLGNIDIDKVKEIAYTLPSEQEEALEQLDNLIYETHRLDMWQTDFIDSMADKRLHELEFTKAEINKLDELWNKYC